MSKKAVASAWALGWVLALGGMAGCGGGGSDLDPTPVASDAVVVKGKVQGAGAVGLGDVMVSVGSSSTLTQADGSFQLAAPTGTTTTVVLLKKPGYGTTAKTALLRAGSATDITVQLYADQVSASFDAVAGTTVNSAGASVTIEPNSVQSANGQAYTGVVQIAASYQSPETLAGAQSFAEPYASADGALLQSVGVIEVKLTTPTGEPLQLKAGAPATLVYPSNTVSGTAASVPLWFYDETRRIWVRDGEATRQADGSYKGTVSHFTLWNADFAFADNTRIRGCFINSQGGPERFVDGSIRTTGFSTSGFSDLDGIFEARVIPGVPLELYSPIRPGRFAPIAISPLVANEVRQLPCVSVTAVPQSSVWIYSLLESLFTPPVVTPPVIVPPVVTPPVVTPPVVTPPASVASFAGQYTGTFGGADAGTFNVNVATIGAVTGTVFSNVYNQAFQVTGTVAAGGNLSLSTSAGSAGAAEYTGVINASGAVSGSWRFVEGLTGSGTFAGQRR